MTLADILTNPASVAGPTDGTGNRRCLTAQTLDTLTNPDRAALTDALHPQSGWSAMRLAKTLNAAGIKISGSAIVNHRSHVCICDTYPDGDTP